MAYFSSALLRKIIGGPVQWIFCNGRKAILTYSPISHYNTRKKRTLESVEGEDDLIPSTSGAREQSGAVDLSSDGNTSTDLESSVTEESCDDSSSSSSSEETQRRKTKKSKTKKNKSKKHKKSKKKDKKNEYDKIK
ncbi:hypothetical protein G5714_010618 [Onychostoma macrolepis]|uniref:Uncharacterized protein n=1 Tax=Onychostoma macrolepis TaxID=369639 RepID=A0A7J6CKL9_9TELE|nr:hypothetical protein G5714_010618 [Onychostoma macrolepis]